MTRLLTIWNVAAAAVYLFGLVVVVTMAGGGLEPVGFAYYGVGADWRTPTLLILLAALQVVWIGDAIVLGLRLKRLSMWAVLIVAAIIGPFTMLVVLGQLDGWRYDHRSTPMNLAVGAVMVLIVATVYTLRHRLVCHGGRPVVS